MISRSEFIITKKNGIIGAITRTMMARLGSPPDREILPYIARATVCGRAPGLHNTPTLTFSPLP